MSAGDQSREVRLDHLLDVHYQPCSCHSCVSWRQIESDRKTETEGGK